LTFLLLDIVVKNSTTRDVLNAVVFPRKQLMATLILGMFLGYIFSFFLFYNFRDEMQDGATKNDCDTLLHCMQTCLSYGLRYGGGINEQLNHTLDTRYVVDVFYFFIIMIIMLNVIFGIIIDTFSDLRSKKNERIQDTTEVCLICSIDKQTFDRADDSSVGFRNHVKNDHNMWAFVSFIVYLWEQDKDDDDGLEQYVRRSVENNDICWFPLNKAMCLEAEGEEDDVSGDLRKDVGGTSETLISNVKNSRNKISDTLDSIAMSLHSLAVSNNDEESVPGDM
jgi:inositol 1,4,5-triphosphate receptor type 3